LSRRNKSGELRAVKHGHHTIRARLGSWFPGKVKHKHEAAEIDFSAASGTSPEAMNRS